MNDLVDVVAQIRSRSWDGATLATLDPGLSPALALWRRTGDGWQLVSARRGHDRAAEGNHLVRGLSVGQDVATDSRTVNFLVTEWPESRAAGRSVNRPDQLFPMIACAAGVAIEFGFSASTTFTLTPSAWAGSTPKATRGDPRLSVRGARVWKVLTLAEQQILIQGNLVQHDVLDAVGIGLVVTGRARRGVAAPRSRARE
jgi:hypothetical protein